MFTIMIAKDTHNTLLIVVLSAVGTSLYHFRDIDKSS